MTEGNGGPGPVRRLLAYAGYAVGGAGRSFALSMNAVHRRDAFAIERFDGSNAWGVGLLVPTVGVLDGQHG